MPKKLTLPGLIDDPRSEEAKSKDYQHQEVAPAAVVLKWNRGIEGAPVYSLRDQDGSGSCVGQSSAKGLETILSKVISAHPIYARRQGAPGVFGMWLQDAGNIIKNLGTTTEDRDPSQRMTEDEMNKPVSVDTPINGYLYASVDVTDIDKIAEAIEVRKHCVVTIQDNLQNYAYSEKPATLPNPVIDMRHAICGVYYFTDNNNEKCILIDESWGPNNIRRRILTESYLKVRGTGAMYFVPPVPLPTPVKPHFNFTVPLQYGQTSYGVKMFQDIAKYENLFPINVPSTAYFGEITRKAVLAWQVKHQVAPIDELVVLNGKRIGQKTIKKLNELYN